MKQGRGYWYRIRLEEATLHESDRGALQRALEAKGLPLLVIESLLDRYYFACDRLVQVAPGYAKAIRAAFAHVIRKKYRPKRWKCPRKHKALSAATFRRWNLPHRTNKVGAR